MKKILTLAALLFLIIVNITSQSFNLDSGLILYYPFDGNPNDYSGNNNHGIEYSDQIYVKGVDGLAHDFNGKTDYLELTNTLDGSHGLTLSCWIFSRGVNGEENNGSIISKYSMAGNNRCFVIRTFGCYEIGYIGDYPDSRYDNKLWCCFYNDGTPVADGRVDRVFSDLTDTAIQNWPNKTFYSIINPKEIQLNEWNHCIVNFKGNDIELWINGELTVKKDREYEDYYDNINEPTYIGNSLNAGEGNNNHFNGLLDELRIYNRALDSMEIQQLYYENYCFKTIYDTIPVFDSIAVTDTLIIDIEITGLNPPNNINKIKVYPNPTSDAINIHCGNYNLMMGYTTKIINSQSQVIFESNIIQQEFKVDISSFGATGLYFIQIIDDSSNLIDVRKILLE